MKASLDPKVWWLRAQKDLRFETQISELNTLFMPSHYPLDYADPIGDAEARKSLEVTKTIRDLLQPLI